MFIEAFSLVGHMFLACHTTYGLTHSSPDMTALHCFQAYSETKTEIAFTYKYSFMQVTTSRMFVLIMLMAVLF
jgi:hypothetical protein